MSVGDPDTERLRKVQTERARDERDQAREAESEADARAHDRRAEKAAYLASRLAEQERSETEER